MAQKELLISLINILIYRYLEFRPIKSNEEFEEWINRSADKPDQYTKEEAVAAIKHFRKEIFPLEIETITWMWRNLKQDDINYYTRFKEMEKLK
jgi:hypothetical protein